MNKVFLIGRMTSEPELRYTNAQTAVLRFNVALDRGKDKNGADRGADFPSVLAFSRTAENLSKFVGKGNRVAIDGHIQTGRYTKQNGDTVYTTDVIADRVEFIDWKESGPKPDNQAPAGFETISDDDVPF